MIAPSSLSALTAASSPVVRAAAPAPSRAVATAAVPKPLGGLPLNSAPPRAAPRGSLLDVSI